MKNFVIALAQVNMMVGAFTKNYAKIVEALDRAERAGAALCVFPELTITAYPPEDWLLRRDFIAAARATLERITAYTAGLRLIAVVGFPEYDPTQQQLFNSAAVLAHGKVTAIYRKQALPNYGVFDEKRYFATGSSPLVFDAHGVRWGVMICEDLWKPGIAEASRAAGADVLLSLNASPFHAKKIHEREGIIRERVNATGLPIVYVNLVGSQDELVFDGASFVMNAHGEVIQRAPEFDEQLVLVNFNGAVPQPGVMAPAYQEVVSEYRALVLGIRDYVSKNGFRGAILGLSGGIDSALTAALAADALGAERVSAIAMPSPYTQAMSLEDAAAEARALGLDYHVIPIEPAMRVFQELLAPHFAGLPRDVTEENIQARCRGLLLMALSNKQGKLLLTTGNKSEMSVGYATLYGDMAGGFAPLKDVPKLLVYRLAHYRNRLAPVIPPRVLERPPSAELAPGQIDEDSLPPYAILDPILEYYVEQDLSLDDIVARGFRREDVARVLRMVDRSEYKRRQSPPGVRITPRAFGRDRRYPITHGVDWASCLQPHSDL